MDRRGFLKSTGVAAALVAAPAAATKASAGSSPAAPAVLTGPRRFGMSSNWADSVSGPADIAHRLALRIHEASGGQLQLTLKHASPTNASASFAESEIEFHHGCEHDRSSLHPAFAYFTGLPSSSGLAAADLETWISYSGGQELWDDLAASYGYKPLLAGHLGTAPMLWTTRPLSDRDSFRDLRIAGIGPTADLARALGANPVAIQPQQLPLALETADVDAVEFGAILNAMGAGITQRARFGYAPGLAQSGTAVALNIRLDVWEGLSSADRAIITACASEAYRRSLSEARLSNSVLLETLNRKHPLKLAALPEDVAAALPHLSKAVVANLAGYDAISKHINASYMGFRRRLLNEHLSGSEAPPTA